MPRTTRANWSRIRLLAMDVDGILTDGRVLIFSNGTEAKQFSILDGKGLGLVAEAGIEVAWISGRASEATMVRARELKIPHLSQGQRRKIDTLREMADGAGVTAEEVCYMGDDLIDVECLEWAGIGVTVPEGVPEARAAADFVTTQSGGLGAVREVCDILLAARRS